MLDKYKAIMFDVAGTLMDKYPNETEILIDRCNFIDQKLTRERAVNACNAANAWVNQQILREINADPYMDDDEFYMNIMVVTLKEALNVGE